MNETALIRVTQLPVIEEQLRAVKEAVEKETLEAASLVCTEDTIQTVKAKRAELNKQFEALEAQRKAVKKAVLEPYERFERVYEDCIKNPFKLADVALKDKIVEVEDTQKAECEKKCWAYFAELCAVHGVEWLRYEQAGLKISLTEAKKKTPSGLFDKLSDFVARVACDVDAIGSDAELMTEYKANGLNLAKAQKTIRDRREATEMERKAAEERAERQKREAEAAAKVEAAAPVTATPVAVEAPREAEPILTCTFTVRGTRAQLIKVREFMKREGIEYE